MRASAAVNRRPGSAAVGESTNASRSPWAGPTQGVPGAFVSWAPPHLATRLTPCSSRRRPAESVRNGPARACTMPSVAQLPADDAALAVDDPKHTSATSRPSASVSVDGRGLGPRLGSTAGFGPAPTAGMRLLGQGPPGVVRAPSLYPSGQTSSGSPPRPAEARCERGRRANCSSSSETAWSWLQRSWEVTRPPTVAVTDLDAGSAVLLPAVAPLHQRHQHRQQVGSLLGQPIALTGALAGLLVGLALQDPGGRRARAAGPPRPARSPALAPRTRRTGSRRRTPLAGSGTPIGCSPRPAPGPSDSGRRSSRCGGRAPRSS